MLKTKELEKILIKNWSEFLDIRKVLSYAKNIAEQQLEIQNPKIITVIVTRCELQNNGMLIWIDYKILDFDNIVNATTEFFLEFNGKTNHIKTI
jgi:hypothetical protein